MVTVRARMPAQVDCATLDIPATQPLLVTANVVHDSTGKALETTTSVGLSDYSMPMLTIPAP